MVLLVICLLFSLLTVTVDARRPGAKTSISDNFDEFAANSVVFSKKNKASASTNEVDDPSGNLLPPLMGSETSINNNNVKNEAVAEVKEKKRKSKPMQKKVKHEQKQKKSSDNLHKLMEKIEDKLMNDIFNLIGNLEDRVSVLEVENKVISAKIGSGEIILPQADRKAIKKSRKARKQKGKQLKKTLEQMRRINEQLKKKKEYQGMIDLMHHWKQMGKKQVKSLKSKILKLQG